MWALCGACERGRRARRQWNMAKAGTGKAAGRRRFNRRRLFAGLGTAVMLLCVAWAIFYYLTDWTRAGFLFHWYREYEQRLAEVGELADTTEGRKILAGLNTAALEQTKHKVRYDSALYV